MLRELEARVKRVKEVKLGLANKIEDLKHEAQQGEAVFRKIKKSNYD